MSMLLKLFACTGTILLGLLVSFPASARYVPDASIAPNGVIDISIHGDVAIDPGALYTSVGGNEFITVAQRVDTLAVCAFTTSAVLQDTFGSNGCYRETLAANEYAYQLLVGKSGYWVFIADSSNPKRFSLLRLTTFGQPDTSYGLLGRRSFDLACDASDVAMRCPEVQVGAQQYFRTKKFIAETSDSNLWLLAARKTSTGANEGIVLHIEQGRNITARANLFDALPPSWNPTTLGSLSRPIDLVSHGDGVLVEQITNGYQVIRVAGNGAIDRSFAVSQPNGIIVAGDSAIPAFAVQMPVVASDNTFCWDLSSQRYDRYGVTLGTLSKPAFGAYVIAAPSSFASAATALWMSDGTRVGRWQNGQWDATLFGGHGPFQPTPSPTLFALTGNETSLAMVTAAYSSVPAQLSILSTQLNPLPLVAPVVAQSDAVLAAGGFWRDQTSSVRSATQADGKTVWQRVTIDPLNAAPNVVTGTLASLPPSLSRMVVSDAASSGARWAIRTLAVGNKPDEFYSDFIGANVPTRRINMDAIRADMPPFIPTTPFGNPNFVHIDIASDGSALALVSYAHGTSSAYYYRQARLRWNLNSVVANEYRPQIEQSCDFGAGQRDPQGRTLLFDSDGKSIRRISPQCQLDLTFAQAGTLDLQPLGFSEPYPIMKSLADGGAWIGTATRLVHVDGNGQLLAQVDLAPQAPAINSSGAMVFSGLLAEADGSVLVVSAAPQDPLLQSRSFRLLRYTPAGELDKQFGLRGAETLVVNGGGASTPTILPLANRGLAALSDNAISVFRFDPMQSGASGTTVPVVEYYNTTLNHYFMTADPVEIASIEAGTAGPGWSRTGQTFNAYANLRDAPGDALDICRFYGSAVPLARSPNGRTGPNSHFYTFAGPECDNVYKNDKAWQYEGPRLALVSLLANNTCAVGLQPVFRAYNNGYELRGGVWAKNDSNHRYSTSQATISEMVGKGWIDEGRRFCAPN